MPYRLFSLRLTIQRLYIDQLLPLSLLCCNYFIAGVLHVAEFSLSVDLRRVCVKRKDSTDRKSLLRKNERPLFWFEP